MDALNHYKLKMIFLLPSVALQSLAMLKDQLDHPSHYMLTTEQNSYHKQLQKAK